MSDGWFWSVLVGLRISPLRRERRRGCTRRRARRCARVDGETRRGERGDGGDDADGDDAADDDDDAREPGVVSVVSRVRACACVRLRSTVTERKKIPVGRRRRRRRWGDGVRCVRKKTRKRRGGFVDTMRCVEIVIDGEERGRIDIQRRVWFFARSLRGVRFDSVAVVFWIRFEDVDFR